MILSGLTISGSTIYDQVPPAPIGQRLWAANTTTAFYFADSSALVTDPTYTTTWTVPAGVTSISIVCVGAGGAACYQDTYVIAGGGGGGGLAYENNVAVTPGELLIIRYGRGKIVTNSTGYGSMSAVIRNSDSTFLCGASGGGNATSTTPSPNLSSVGGAGGKGIVRGSTTSSITTRTGSGTTSTGGYGQGGPGGYGQGGNTTGTSKPMFGGGGAGGYGGAGGDGSGYNFNANPGTNGGGGGGGRGSTSGDRGGAGGGTNPYGQQSNGAAGSTGAPGTTGGGGNTTYVILGKGSDYGGGGGGLKYTDYTSNNNYGAGGNGCVRIIWPGDLRQFPSTRTTDE
jgi:hypothetical protein